MGVPTVNTGPMTIEEFYAFTDGRPDNEKWELIDGEPVLHASPSPFHQRIAQVAAYLRSLGQSRTRTAGLVGGVAGTWCSRLRHQSSRA